jgi:hypothetical protein
MHDLACASDVGMPTTTRAVVIDDAVFGNVASGRYLPRDRSVATVPLKTSRSTVLTIPGTVPLDE